MISNEKLIGLYSVMLKCRMIAERACVLARQGRLASSLDSGVGREASIAGIAIDLQAGDTLSPSRGALALEFVKGTPLEEIFAVLAASANGLPYTAIATEAVQEVPLAMGEPQLDHACAAAKAHKTANDAKVAIVFCDETKPHPGRWRRSLSLASRQNLPLIFVRHLKFRDGLDHTPVRRKIREGPPEALAFGVAQIQVDGDDVVAVYRVASESFSRARQGRGPTLIDCITDISADHFGNQSETDSRTPAGGPDPIRVMENHLSGKQLWKPELRKQIEDEFGRELDRATRLFGKKSNVKPALSSEVSRPFDPGPRLTFIPGNDVF